MRMNFRRNIALFLILSGLVACGGENVREEEIRNREIGQAEQEFDSSSWPERLHAVQTAGKWVNARSQVILINAINDPHYRVRIEAVKGLSNFRSVQSFETLKDIAEKEKYLPLRIAAVQSLACFQSPRAAKTFVSLMNNDEWMIRESAIAGLLDIPDKNIEEMSIKYAIDALSDVNESVRIAALSHIRVKEEQIFFILRAQLADESLYYRPELLKKILKVLIGYKLDVNLRKSVMGLITHPNTEVRTLAYQCITASDQMK